MDVDLKGIDSSTVRNYPLVLPKGVARADPAEVQISIKVKTQAINKIARKVVY